MKEVSLKCFKVQYTNKVEITKHKFYRKTKVNHENSLE